MRGKTEAVVGACEADEALFVWSTETGALLHQFKESHCGQSKLTCVKDRYVVGRHAKKPAINVWEWGKEQPIHTCYVSERLMCLSVDSSGTYIAGGSPTGTIYLWHVESGEFLCSWKAHYRSLSHLLFLAGEFVLVSSGEDALIHCWNLIDILSGDGSADTQKKPIVTWSEHSLPVTSLSCSSAGGVDALVLSSSLDHTCRLWQLDKRRSTRAVSASSPILCCTIDVQEQYIYAGGRDGNIFEKFLKAPAGLGVVSSSSSSSRSQHEGALGSEGFGKIFSGHKSAVTSVSCSYNGRSLVSSSQDGVIYVWNRESGERMRTITREMSPISYATVFLSSSINDETTGDDDLSVLGSSSSSYQALQPFKKYKTSEKDLVVQVKAWPESAFDRVYDSAATSNAACAACFRAAKLTDTAEIHEIEGLGGDVEAHKTATSGDRSNRDQYQEQNRKLREELNHSKLELEKKEERLNAVEKLLLEHLQTKNSNPYD